MENFALKHNLMQQSLQQIVKEREVFILQIERDHPGYRWSEGEGLVAEHLKQEKAHEPEPYPETTPR